MSGWLSWDYNSLFMLLGILEVPLVYRKRKKNGRAVQHRTRSFHALLSNKESGDAYLFHLFLLPRSLPQSNSFPRL